MRAVNPAEVVIALEEGEVNRLVREEAGAQRESSGDRQRQFVRKIAVGIDAHVGGAEEIGRLMIRRDAVQRSTKCIDLG